MGRAFLMGGKVGMQNPGSRLPKGYTELAYIQSSGTQYINTEVAVNANTYKKLRFVLDNQYPSLSGNYWLVNGCSGSGVIYYFGAATGGAIYYGNGTQDIYAGGSAATNRQTIEFDPANGRFVFGNVLSLTGLAFNAPSGSSNFHLFAYNKGSSSDCHAERIFSCKIYSDGELIRDLVPCMSDAEGVGLYDIVNNKFYGNAGTGSFVGSEVAA